MASLLDEKIITFEQAAKLLPARRRGRKAHVSTLYRWASKGVRGVILETVQVGGTKCTTVRALETFLRRLSSASADSRSCQSSRAADAALKSEGF